MSTSHTTERPSRRLVALVLTLLLGAALVPLAAPADAATPKIRSIEAACPSGYVPESGFADTAGTTFAAAIECVRAYAVASGQSAGTYNPSGTVNRAQLATFIANILQASGKTRPSNVPNRFSDVSGDHAANINWIAGLGIVGGYGDGTFRPGERVTRAQMASFLNGTVKAIEGQALSSSVDYFNDDSGSPHEANINALAAAGIVGGVGDGRFSPRSDLSRGQMAGFLARSVDRFVVTGRISVPFGASKLAITPTSAVTRLLSTSSGDNVDRGQREFTIEVPLNSPKMNLALFPAGNVKTVNGELRFVSSTPIAKDAGTSIEEVNGVVVQAAATGIGTVQVNNVQPKGGKITVVVDSVDRADVVPVLWFDTVKPTENTLDIGENATSASPKAALETVVVGGGTEWFPPEATEGVDVMAGTVREVNLGERWYTLDTDGSPEPDVLVRWSTTGETFRYTATGSSTIARTQFESWLSVGDTVDPGVYKPGTTTHVITGDIPYAPTGVTVAVTPEDTVQVSFTKPSNPVASISGSSFRLQRATVTGASVGTFAEIASFSGTATPTFTNVPATSARYAYRIVARSSAGDSPESETKQIDFVAARPATVASSIVDTSSVGTLSSTDRLIFTFDRAVSVSSGWSVVVRDADGDTGTLSASNASISVSGTGSNVVTLTVTGTVAGGSIGTSTTTGFLQVMSATGIGNAAGVWNLPRSGIDNTMYNNSRVVIRRGETPAAPGGHIVRTSSTNTFEFGRNEVQRITNTDHTGGNFKLAFDGQTMAGTLNHDATPEQIQAGLESLSNIAPGDVVVTGGPLNTVDTPVVITFQGTKSALNVEQITIVDNVLTGGATDPVASTTTEGAAVTGIIAGDKIRVYDASGILRSVDGVVAGVNGRTSVTLTHTVSAGSTYYVVVEKAAGGRLSRTTAVVS